MQTTVVTIGNYLSIRIPRPLLEESGIEKEVELVVKKGELRIRPVKRHAHVTAQLSERALAQDWDNPEEDEAWKNL